MREEHEENCEKDEVAQEHADVHDQINRVIQRTQSMAGRTIRPAARTELSGLVVFIMIMAITAFVMITIFATVGSSGPFRVLSFLIPLFPMLIFAFVIFVIISAAKNR